jgi:hypothetical protein
VRVAGIALVALVVASASCGGGEPSAPGGSEDPATAVALEPQEATETPEAPGSGRTLSGLYTLERATPPDAAATWAFSSDGGFTRTRTLDHGRGDRADAGTYVIDVNGNVEVYVERRGDARLSWAERETYGLGGDPATAIALTARDGREIRLVRTGDAPPAAQGGPRGE